jgi:hypothetical protein
VSTHRLAPRRDLLLSVILGVTAGAYVWWYYNDAVPSAWSDFDQIWLGARALLARQDPYAAVRESFAWPLYYPLPALFFGLPFAAIPLVWARVAFAAVSAGITLWTVLRYRPQAWPMLCSIPFVYAIQRGQWVPLLLVAALVPGAVSGSVLAAKPNMGLALFAYRPSRSAIVGALVVALLSILVRPSWPWAWLDAIRSAPHIRAPILLPGGLVLTLALLRWRDPGARLLSVLALTPQTRALYELLPLALLPPTRRMSLVLALLFNALALLIRSHWGTSVLSIHPGSGDNLAALDMSWFPMLLLGYLPALGLVLAAPPAAERGLLGLAWRVLLGLLVVFALLLAWYIWRYRVLFAG